MSYASLLSEGRIRAQTFAPRELERFVLAAEAKLGDAGIEGHTDDTTFVLAYDAVRTAAEAVMAAEGYRPTSGEGQHAAVFEFLEETESGRWADDAREFDRARKKRNVSQYERFGLITETQADELRASARVFVGEVRDWLDERGLLSPGD
jgi:uncharacterized protein (UPF0332 family)